jgi:hypothetical protein
VDDAGGPYFAVRIDAYAMYDHPDYFPSFGNGDLRIKSTGAVSCIMNNAFTGHTNGLNNFELCSNGQVLEEMEVWYLKEQPTVGLMLAEYSIGGAHVGRTSHVASAQEVMTVSMIVGYPPRADLWKMCYNVATDTNTSQTFHDKCDNVGTAFLSFAHSLTCTVERRHEFRSFQRHRNSKKASTPPT